MKNKIIAEEDSIQALCNLNKNRDCNKFKGCLFIYDNEFKNTYEKILIRLGKNL